VTECQGCGAWNERHRTLCVLCGTPLAETDEWDAAAELPPLPPLPDGGLSLTMPAWLRALPGNPEPDEPQSKVFLATEEETIASVPVVTASSAEEGAAVAAADSRVLPPLEAMPAEPSLGPQADPRTFLRDEDFPRWIRELPALPPRPIPPVTVIAPPVTEPAHLVAPRAPAILRPDPPPASQESSPQALNTVTEAVEPSQIPASSPAVPAAPPDSPARRREAWEMPLLVVLVVGVVAAVIWALLINGLIGSGL
jgi:hypothetical protein